MSDIDTAMLRDIRTADQLTDATRPYFAHGEPEIDLSYASSPPQLSDAPDPTQGDGDGG